MTIYLLPAVLPLSVPVGLAMGAALGARGRGLSNRVIAAVMLVALATSAVSFVTVGWVTPSSNQAYREAITGARWLNKGDRELTLIELRHPLAERDREGARRASIEFHQRLSFALAPVAFAAFGLVIAIRRRPSAVGALGAVGLAAFGHYVAMWMARDLSQTAVLPTYVGPWMPSVALILMTLLLGLQFGMKSHPKTRVS